MEWKKILAEPGEFCNQLDIYFVRRMCYPYKKCYVDRTPR